MIVQVTIAADVAKSKILHGKSFVTPDTKDIYLIPLYQFIFFYGIF